VRVITGRGSAAAARPLQCELRCSRIEKLQIAQRSDARLGVDERETVASAEREAEALDGDLRPDHRAVPVGQVRDARGCRIGGQRVGQIERARVPVGGT
jgi:hypothetical protein